MEKTQTILAAVKRHHGGFDQATDEQCWIVWNSLPLEVQTRYLKEESGARSQEPEKHRQPSIENRK